MQSASAPSKPPVLYRHATSVAGVQQPHGDLGDRDRDELEGVLDYIEAIEAGIVVPIYDEHGQVKQGRFLNQDMMRKSETQKILINNIKVSDQVAKNAQAPDRMQQ